MNGFWQSAKNFFTGRETYTTAPALTPEGKALGFEWEMPANIEGPGPKRGVLWPSADEAMTTGPLGAVERVHPAAGWTINGNDDYDAGFGLDEAMNIAEGNAATRIIEPLSEASKSYYASLAALAESRGAEMDRNASDRDFGLDL